MTFMTTVSGRVFDLEAPRADAVCIDDIAHALAHICRFGGHTQKHYSVAQHSILVSQLVPHELALEGLLHDATEAYVGDVISPIKVGLPRYRALEDRVWEAVAARFGLDPVLPLAVKAADSVMLATEIRDLRPPARDPRERAYIASLPAPRGGRIVPLDAWQARELFLLRYQELAR